jgi:hypothetical protein
MYPCQDRRENFDYLQCKTPLVVDRFGAAMCCICSIHPKRRGGFPSLDIMHASALAERPYRFAEVFGVVPKSFMIVFAIIRLLLITYCWWPRRSLYYA